MSKVGSREGGAGEYEAGGICMPTLFGLGRGWRMETGGQDIQTIGYTALGGRGEYRGWLREWSTE